jgi:nicotinamidase-related amidase
MIVDLQKAIDHPSQGERNNFQAEEHCSALLKLWRELGWPIFHVRHNSIEPTSHYRPGQPGNNFKSEVMPLPNEIIIVKKTNSAFIGTDLESRLKTLNFIVLVVVGVSTNNSVEATVRMAGNLGFETYLVSDATFTFDRVDWGGRYRTADEVHDMSLANLNNEYCTIIDTATAIQMACVVRED